MNHILKLYYGIENNIKQTGYFEFQNELYYLTYLQDVSLFLEIYQYYRYLMNQCHCLGYSCIKNFNEDIISNHHVLLIYHQEEFDFQLYLQAFLQPIPTQKIYISQIKEQWICKIDSVKDLVRQYAYSFKHNPELVSLIYYYTGLGENCICILNEILAIQPHASLSIGLSLKSPISHYVHDLLNPDYYVLSTRMRHLVYLLKSDLLSFEDLRNILETYYFDVYELIYFYARFFYPAQFFEEVLTQRLSNQRVQYYLLEIKKEKEMYQKITSILSFYVSLPKIGWINRKNMV